MRLESEDEPVPHGTSLIIKHGLTGQERRLFCQFISLWFDLYRTFEWQFDEFQLNINALNSVSVQRRPPSVHHLDWRRRSTQLPYEKCTETIELKNGTITGSLSRPIRKHHKPKNELIITIISKNKILYTKHFRVCNVLRISRKHPLGQVVNALLQNAEIVSKTIKV